MCIKGINKTAGNQRGKRNSGKKDKDKDKSKEKAAAEKMASWDEVLQVSKESQHNEDIFDMEDFSQANTDAKLDLLMVGLNKLNKTFAGKTDAVQSALHHEDSGLIAKTHSLSTKLEDLSNSSKILVDQVEDNSEKN